MKRSEFRKTVFNRDGGICLVPWCDEDAVDAHHIYERELWENGGYIPENGASVCNDHHRMAEQNEIPPQAFHRWIGVEDPPLPQSVNSPAVNKWGESWKTPDPENLREYQKYPSTRHLLPLYWNSERGTAAERTGRDDTGLMSVESFLDIPLVATIKMDGCLPYNQHVLTENAGQVPIGKIVNQEMDVSVLSLNEDTGEKEYKEIVNYFNNGKTDNWVKISHEKVGQSERIVATPNHEVYTNNGKVCVSNISIGDKLKLSKPKLTDLQKKLVLGSLLGDGSLNNKEQPNPLFEEAHGQYQHDYVDWKVSILGDIVSNTNTYMSAYDEDHKPTEKKNFHTTTLPSLNKYRSMVVDGGGRTVPDWLELTPKVIAVWFCDDGNTKFSDVQRPRASFNTQCFSGGDCNKLVSMLREYNIDGSVNDYGSGPVIELTTDSSENLYYLISKYVPQCMEYKIPDKYWTDECNWDKGVQEYEYAEITDIDEAETFSPMKFDIEVKDNHNYYTSEVLVSNSNTMIVSDKDEPVRARNGRDATHESFDHLKQEYWERNVYGNLPEHLQVFGENLYAKHSIHYARDHSQCGHGDRDSGPPVSDVFQVFGVYDTRYDLWLSWHETEEIADQIGFPLAPATIDQYAVGPHSDGRVFTKEMTMRGEYAVDNGHEGIIVRSAYPFHYDQFTHKLGKYVRPNHVQTDEHWSHQQTVRNEIEK